MPLLTGSKEKKPWVMGGCLLLFVGIGSTRVGRWQPGPHFAADQPVLA